MHRTYITLILSVLYATVIPCYAQRVIVEQVTEKAIYLPSKRETSGDIETLMKNLRYSEAESLIKKKLTLAKKRKKDTTTLELQLEQCSRGLQMLRGTDRLTVIDSVVVDKRKFLEGYKASKELGKIRLAKDGRTTEFETERGSQLYKAETINNTIQLVSYYIENGQLTNRKVIEGLDVDGDLNYPFLMSDGITLYFAARSTEGLGNYDLYITRYDDENEKFYKAENLGFPYNSYANDYMLVIDEEHKIGWFASDRYQPNDKVCIYTFIPNTSRHPYDYENEDSENIIRAASLRSFKSTWNKSNEQARLQARQTLALMSLKTSTEQSFDFTLIINDKSTYHYYSEFHSSEAKKQCREWVQKQQQLDKLNKQIEKMRSQYATSDAGQKKTMKKQILYMEKQIIQLTDETRETEKLIRNLEHKQINTLRTT